MPVNNLRTVRWAKTWRAVISGSRLFNTVLAFPEPGKNISGPLGYAPKRLPSRAAPSFRQPLNHLLGQLWADTALFVLEVNKRFLPLILLGLDKFRPAVDVGRLVILAP